jgi:hypothetical protein
MGTLLRYDVSTSPFPLQASPADGAPSNATLTVVAANPTPSTPVTLQGVNIAIPVGPDAKSLTADATGVGPVAPAGWRLQATKPGSESVEYVFVPQPGQGSVGRQGLAFVFNNIRVNTQPGPCQLTVKEGSTGSPTTQLAVTKFPAGWGTVAFWANPPNVTPGQSATLNWAGPAGATYSIEYFTPQTGLVSVPAQGAPPLGNRGQYPVGGEAPLLLSQTTVFTLSVRQSLGGQNYFAQQQTTATVQVSAPTIESYTATPTFDAPTTVRLAWEAENVSQLHIDGVGIFSGDEALNGSHSYSPRRPGRSVAVGYGQPGYSGPPAYAQAEFGISGAVTSPLLNVWVQKLQPTPLWVIAMRSNQKLFEVASSVNSLNNNVGNQQDYTATLQLSPGLRAAFLGTGRGGTSFDAVAGASFQPATTLGDIWRGFVLNLSDDIFSENPVNVGHTWAVKFPDDRLALVWYQGASPSSDSYGTHTWSFSFQWIDYGKVA